MGNAQWRIKKLTYSKMETIESDAATGITYKRK